MRFFVPIDIENFGVCDLVRGVVLGRSNLVQLAGRVSPALPWPVVVLAVLLRVRAADRRAIPVDCAPAAASWQVGAWPFPEPALIGACASYSLSTIMTASNTLPDPGRIRDDAHILDAPNRETRRKPARTIVDGGTQ